MKKIISLVLSSLMLFSTVPVYAVEPISVSNNQKMEEMTLVVKNRLGFQDSEEFRSSVSTTEDGMINLETYNLNWEFKDSSITVDITENGFISNYRIWDNTPQEERKSVLFTVTKEQAKETANTFINQINPDVAKEYKLDKVKRDTYYFNLGNLTSRLRGDSYIVTYVRTINGSPFISDIMNVRVSGFENKVTSYNGYYHGNIIFDNKDGIKTLEEAKEIFKSNLDLEYSYMIQHNYSEDEDGKYTDKPIGVLVYRDKTASKYLEATTGKLYKEDSRYIAYDYESSDKYFGAVENATMADSITGSSEGAYLTEEEKAEILDTKDVLEIENLFKEIKDLGYFDISADATIYSYRLVKDQEENTKTFYINFSETYEKHSDGSIQVNAKTGKVESFQNYRNNHNSYNYKDLARRSQYAIDFVENYTLKGKEVSLNVADRGIDFTFYREINYIKCYDNYITVNLNPDNNRVNYFRTYWTEDVEFVSPDGVISFDVAKQHFISNFNYKLFYYVDDNLLIEGDYTNRRGVLAYAYENDFTKKINAHTKEFLDYSNQIYDAKRYEAENFEIAENYTNISGHWAENIILSLQNNNIGFKNADFNPNDAITMSEIFELLGTVITDEDYTDFKEYIKMRELQGISFVEEKEINSTLSREEFVALIISISEYGYDKILDKNDFFKTNFVDENLISADKIGYISVAKMLGYLSGETFRPKDFITKAEVCAYLYKVFTNI